MIFELDYLVANRREAVCNQKIQLKNHQLYVCYIYDIWGRGAMVAWNPYCILDLVVLVASIWLATHVDGQCVASWHIWLAHQAVTSIILDDGILVCR